MKRVADEIWAVGYGFYLLGSYFAGWLVGHVIAWFADQVLPPPENYQVMWGQA